MQYGAIPTSMAERIALAAGLVPVPMLDTLFGMLKARCIMAGVRLGIFEALAQEPRSAASLAAALRLDECYAVGGSRPGTSSGAIASSPARSASS